MDRITILAEHLFAKSLHTSIDELALSSLFSEKITIDHDRNRQGLE